MQAAPRQLQLRINGSEVKRSVRRNRRLYSTGPEAAGYAHADPEHGCRQAASGQRSRGLLSAVKYRMCTRWRVLAASTAFSAQTALNVTICRGRSCTNLSWSIEATVATFG